MIRGWQESRAGRATWQPGRYLADGLHDLQYAIRQWRRAPGFAVAVVATLALGIGATVVMAGEIDRLLFRGPTGVLDPARIARLLFVSGREADASRASSLTDYPSFLDLQRDVTAFGQTAAYSAATVSVGEGATVIEAHASLVSSSYFSLLGASPALGRFFAPSNDADFGGAAEVVLGHGFWRREFAGDSGVLGRSIRVGAMSYVVIGVAPKAFQGADPIAPDAWLPIGVATEHVGLRFSLSDRGSLWLSIVSRLRPGATRAGAEHEATLVWGQAGARARDAGDPSWRVLIASIIRGRGPDKPREARVVLWLGGVSVFVLLIACANVANLLLARAITRRREFAVRLALGASTDRLARQVVAEALFLALLGGASALGLAAVGGKVFERALGVESGSTVQFDARLFGAAATIALGTGVLISLAPLVNGLSRSVSNALQGMVMTVRAAKVRSVLLCVQAALCMVLLIGAGLFAVSLRRVRGLDLGVDPDRTLMVKVDLAHTSLAGAEISATFESMLQRVRALPGVRQAALAENDPYTFGRAVGPFTAEHPDAYFWHAGGPPVPMESAVGAGFFRTTGSASLRGRDFDERDVRGAERVAIINERLARILWPAEDALGQCMRFSVKQSDCVRVVGVLGGFWKFHALDRDRLVVYVPLEQSAGGRARPGTLFVSVNGDHESVAASVRKAVQGVRSTLPAVSVTRMRDIVEQEFRPWRVASLMFAAFGGLALLIAVVGVYGVVAFNAAQRAKETAIRIALGAQRWNVLVAVATDGLRAVGLGIVIGGAVALAGSQWIGPQLFQTSPRDPWTIGAVGLLLIVVAFVASLPPVFAALRGNTSALLRSD